MKTLNPKELTKGQRYCRRGEVLEYVGNNGAGLYSFHEIIFDEDGNGIGLDDRLTFLTKNELYFED